MAKKKPPEKNTSVPAENANLEWDEEAQTRLADWLKARQAHMKWIASALATSRKHTHVWERDIADAIAKWEQQRAEQSYTFTTVVKQKKTIASLRKKLRELKKKKN